MRSAIFAAVLVGFSCQRSPEPESRDALPAAVESVKSYNTISRQQLAEMFQGIEQKSRWDTSQVLLWGYFFTSEHQASLERLRPTLEQHGYRFVKYLQRDERTIYLHVEKEEVHTVDSLHARNEQLAKLGHDFAVKYDGMDVGPVTEK